MLIQIIRRFYKSSICIILTVILACSGKKQQSPVSEPTDNNNDVSVQIILQDIIKKNGETRVKICSDNYKWQIAKAYFDCSDNSDSQIDTTKQTVIGCEKELMIKNDTVRIFFIPTIVGEHKFDDMKLLLFHKDKKEYKIIDTTFHYVVTI